MLSIMKAINVTLAVLLVFSLTATANSSAKTTRACEGLASYQLSLQTLWSKETFETQYPLYRPAAQWSKLVGRSHSRRYSQWALDKLASEALKEFSEQGLSNGFDAESQGSRGIYDAFIGPNIATGVGTSDVKFLAHPNYHKLSFVVRMIPSPDWFIGVDSVDLCTSDGKWKSHLTLDLHPNDAGTDRGFTFTSPNWPEKPQQPITTITSKSPDHPASSFYYPELDELPPIAKVRLTKVDFDWTDTADTAGVTDQVSNGQSTEREKTKRDIVIDRRESSVVARDHLPHVVSSNVRRQSRRSQSSRNRVVSERLTATDCEVSDWSDWSACSKTCGYGRRMRSRSIIRRNSNGGHPCPLIEEEQMCGSMRNCQWSSFGRFNRTLPSASQG